MEEAFRIASTMKWTLNKLCSLIPQSSSSSSKNHPSSAEKELRKLELHKLESMMKSIHATLADAEERDIIDNSEQLRLSELREVAYDADDVMDDYEHEVLRVKLEARRRAMAGSEDDKRDKVFDWNSYCPEVSVSVELICRMIEIQKRFEKITDDWKHLSLPEKVGKRRCIQKWMPTETTSFLDEARTFGRKEEKDEIIEWLLQESNEPLAVSVLAITGMGGIGKTTLAQLVCHDERVSKHFDLHAWICVSEDFDVRGLLRKIINSFSITTNNELTSHESGNNVTLDVLCQYLKRKLEGKRFFIVLDDVWNKRLDLWESLKSPLNGVGFGKILLTARNESVAKIMQTTDSIVLKDLPFDDCWSLFDRIALQGRDHNLQSNLLDIGRRIVEKCKGLPLAVKVLAGILRYEDQKEKWNDILESELWEVESENSKVLPVLKLSYNNMPVELRSCFKYLSLFAKDSELDKEIVVAQWMSHGFLQADGKQTEEDVGNSYFDEFLQRSILQHYNSDPIRFVMHDLIHDLARFVAKDEYLLITSDELCQIPKKTPRTIRHISVYLKDGFDIILLRPLFESKNLRTLLVHKANEFQELCTLIDGSYHNLKCLRTLAWDNGPAFSRQYGEMSDALRHLKHLRYLNSGTYVSNAEPLYSLYHLQTFITSNYAMELCSGIGDLINLRHLQINSCNYMHHEVGWLTNLRRLGCFKVGAESWQLKLRDLEGLVNLRGSLRISGLENVKCSEINDTGAFMKALKGVDDLALSGGRIGEIEMDENENLGKHVLDMMQPHSNLLQMSISGCPILPTWLGHASFSKLHYLYISRSNCTSLPTLGQLPVLKHLSLSGMKRVKIVGREFLQSCSNPLPPAAGAATASASSGCGFPSLEELGFHDMVAWEEWNGVEDGDFPRLRRLKIFNCRKLRALPTLHSLTTLRFSTGWNPEFLSGCRLPMLQTLHLGYLGVPSLILPDYQILRSIKKLIITGNPVLTSIVGIGKLTSLEHLEIKNCRKVRISPNEQLPPGIREVKIRDSPEAERWYKNQVLSGGSGPGGGSA